MLVTHWILLGLTLVLALWDVWLATHPPPGDTISEVIRSTARKYLMVPFGLGVLIGHLLWSQ